jgi:hypothetical protein
MCEQTEQLPCIYPQGPLKPGPKLGVSRTSIIFYSKKMDPLLKKNPLLWRATRILTIRRNLAAKTQTATGEQSQ